MKQKGFASMVLILLLAIVIVLVVLLFKGFKTDNAIKFKISSQVQNKNSGLENEYLQNPLAYTMGNKVILFNPLKNRSEKIIYTGEQCSVVNLVKWSPDKTKLAFNVKNFDNRDGKCFVNIKDVQFLYFDVATQKVNTIRSVKDDGIGNYSWYESHDLYYYYNLQIHKYNLSSHNDQVIRKVDVYEDDNWYGPYYLFNNEMYGKDATSIGKINIKSPGVINKVVDEKLSDAESNRGWGETISDFIVSPDAEKIVYYIDKPSEKSVYFKNLSTGLKTKLLSDCIQSGLGSKDGSNLSLGEFSPDSTKFVLYDSCDKTANIVIYNASAQKVKKLNIDDFEKLNPLLSPENDYNFNTAVWDINSANLFILLGKIDFSNPGLFAFTLNLNNNELTKINSDWQNNTYMFSNIPAGYNKILSNFTWSN